MANGMNAVYCDGGVIGRNPSSLGATWAWRGTSIDTDEVTLGTGYVLTTYAEDLELGPVERHGLSVATNNQSEFMAILRALEALPDGWAGTVNSDSMVALGAWQTPYNADAPLPAYVMPDWWQRAMVALERLGEVRWRRLDGHPTRRQLAAGIGKRGGPVHRLQTDCDHDCTRLANLYKERFSLLETSRKARAMGINV